MKRSRKQNNFDCTNSYPKLKYPNLSFVESVIFIFNFLGYVYTWKTSSTSVTVVLIWKSHTMFCLLIAPYIHKFMCHYLSLEMPDS